MYTCTGHIGYKEHQYSFFNPSIPVDDIYTEDIIPGPTILIRMHTLINFKRMKILIDRSGK